MQIFIYTTDPELLHTINSSSELSDLIGAAWTKLPYSQREVQRDLVYEISLTMPRNADFAGIADVVDRITDGTCLITQTSRRPRPAKNSVKSLSWFKSMIDEFITEAEALAALPTPRPDQVRAGLEKLIRAETLEASLDINGPKQADYERIKSCREKLKSGFLASALTFEELLFIVQALYTAHGHQDEHDPATERHLAADMIDRLGKEAARSYPVPSGFGVQHLAEELRTIADQQERRYGG